MLSRMDTRRNDEGFTMVEILVVIIIIGILAAIAIPIYINQRQAAWDNTVRQDVRNVGAALMGRSESLDRTYMLAGKDAPTEKIPLTSLWWNDVFPDEKLAVSEGTIMEIAFNPHKAQSAWGGAQSLKHDVCIKAGNHAGNEFKGVQWGAHDKAENFIWFDSRGGGVKTAEEIYASSMAGGEATSCYVAGFKYAKENGLTLPPAPPAGS